MNKKSNSLEEMITKRKSVRSISSAPLSESVLSDILSFTEHATPLFPEIKTAVKILGRSEIKTFASIYAPHYLAIYSQRSPDADLNIGFILQQTDLYLSSIGIGSCWLGMTHPVENEFNGLPFVVLLAFGTPQESLHRTSVQQFKRKPLEEISSCSVLPKYMEAARLAPSAINKQPWFFSGDERCCHAFSVRGKGLINIAEGWRFVDLGISLAHIFITATAAGKTVTFEREDSIPSRSGNEYIISCYME